MRTMLFFNKIQDLTNCYDLISEEEMPVRFRNMFICTLCISAFLKVKIIIIISEMK